MRRFQLELKLSTLTISCALIKLLDVLPLFLFRVCECRFVATPGEIVRKMRECVPTR